MSGEMAKVEEVKPTILTPKKIILMIVLSCLITAANQRGPLRWVDVPAILFLILMISPLLKIKWSSADAALFFITFYTAAYFPYIHNWRLAIAYSPKFLAPALWDKVSKVVPSFMIVPKEYLEAVVPGLSSVPWHVWTTPLAYFILMDITILILGLSMAAFWSELFIDIEKLPFPSIVPYIHMISIATEYTDTKPRWYDIKANKAFWLMFIVGAIVGVVIYVSYFSRAPPMPWGDQWPVDLRPYLSAILPGAYLYWWPAFSFSFIGYAYLMSMDLLASIIIFFFIFYWIYPAVGIKTGFLPPGARATGAVPGWDPPTIFPYRLWQFWGIPIALGIAPILFNWKYFISRIKGAFGGSSEVRPGEVPFSWTLITFIVSAILFIAIFSAAGAPVPVVIVWLIIWLLIQTFNMRAVAEAFPFPHRYFQSLGWMLWPVGKAVGAFTTNPDLNTPQFATAFMIGMTDNFWSQGALYPWGMLRYFKMATDLKLSRRDAFIASIIAIIIGSITCLTMYVFLSYYLGLSTGRWYRDTVVTRSQLWGPTRWRWFWDRKGPTVTDWRAGWFVGGIVLALVLIKLRTMFPWFFLNLVGVFFAWHSWFVGSAIIAFVLKYLTIKIGGARWYEEYGVPAVSGYIVGTTVVGMFFIIFETIYCLIYNTWYLFM